MASNIFNIPGSCSFVDVLAKRFMAEYASDPVGLSKVLFLVPNRRAVISLKDAFIRFNGEKPAILPQIIPVGDLGDEDVFLPDMDQAELLETLPPAIDEYEKLFLFAKLISSRPKEYGLPQMTPSQAFALAGDLSKMLDSVYNEQLSLENLKNLVPDQYAAHWQETLKFLQIIMTYWPEILKERGMIDRAFRQNILLERQAQALLKNPPAEKIVAAGVTGAFPGVKKLLSQIKNLPKGQIYLYNLDRLLDEEIWEEIDENHPQYEHKRLLEFLEVKREEIEDAVSAENPQRDLLVAQMMRPAKDSWHWQHLKTMPIDPEGVKNLHIVNCKDSRQEASCVALILREVLSVPEKTAALVTSDRNLARRTASELQRWGIKIDDSAGKPLHLSPVCTFLRLMISVLENQDSEAALLSLMKNPYMRMQEDPAELRQSVRAWEKRRRMPKFDGTAEQDLENEAWYQKLLNIMSPLKELFAEPKTDFKILLEKHIETAEALSGAENLWRGEDGRAAAAFLNKILPSSSIVGTIDPHQYLSLLTVLFSTQIYRSNYSTHPRIKILGPIEARLMHFDTIVVGSVNEGVWPVLPSSDPWMSRPMKKDFGMPLPERSVGIMAADFAGLLSAPEVYITRAARANGSPAGKSRWLLRLETVLDACGYKLESFFNQDVLFWSNQINQPKDKIKIEPPAPCPPIAARPRKLSASSIETLMRDPYEIFASKILKLKPLNPLDAKAAPSDYGNIVHKILENFSQIYPSTLDDKALDVLIKIGLDEFSKRRLPPQVRAFWWPMFEKTAEWLVKEEKSYRTNIAKVFGEVKGQIEFEVAGGKFTLEARADRVDLTKDGKINIIDYKTGEIRSNNEIDSGYAPQLPLEGLIASMGGFVGRQDQPLPAQEVEQLMYWQLGNKSQSYSKDIEKLLDKTYDHIKKLITAFDLPTTPYLARPNPKHLPKYANYEHLARTKEWLAGDESDE